MRITSSSLAVATLVALGALSGCPTPTKEALVVFNVEVAADVMTYAQVRFTADQPAGVPERSGPATPRTFRFGYYMPGVNGTVIIRGRAYNAAGCTVGQGTLTVMNVVAGSTTEVADKLTIAALASPACPTDARDGGGDVRDGGSDAPVDAPADTREAGAGDTPADAGSDDAPVVVPDGGGGGDAGGDAPPAKKINGETCAAGNECASTFCVDGVCCESACAGQCEACAEGTTKGVCQAVTSGAPRGARTACAGSGVCQGSCGAGNRTACTFPGATTQCREPSCAASTGRATLAASCNGAGACPAAETVDCAPNTCAGTICAGGCSTSQPCTGSNYCRAGVCVAKKSNGMTCAAVDECTSGNCVDGVCCNDACAGACVACNLTATPGTCSPVRSAADNACTGTMTCDATGACKKTAGQTCAAGAECASGSCVDGRCCTASVCGTCQACTGGGGTCVAVTNADDDSCGGTTQSCDAIGACKKRTGQSCTAGSECLSTICADGVCCNSACTGSCQFCNNAGSAGTCGFVSGTPRTGHPACTGTGVCAGSCSGTSAACTYPGSTTSCRASSCASGTETRAAGCNGAGSCPAVVTAMCTPFMCNGTTACATSCAAASECVANAICSSGVCTPCATGQTVCSNQCVTLATSAAHCGSCGHSCRGGTCVGGKCQPVQVYTSTLDYTTAIAQGRIYIMHPESTGVPQTTISYVSVDAAPGTAVTPYATIPMEGCSYLRPDTATGDLFSTCSPLTSAGVRMSDMFYVRRIPPSGGSGNRLFQVNAGALGTADVYPQSNFIYFTELSTAAMRRGTYTSTTVTNLMTYPAADTMHGSYGIDQTSLYFMQSVGGIMSLRQGALASGATTTLMAMSSPSGLYSDNTNVFFWRGASGVFRLPKGTTSTSATTIISEPTLAAMAPVDASSIYYGTAVDAVSGATGCTSYRVARRPKAGGTEEPLFDGVDQCMLDMQGDANIVTWRTRGRGCLEMTCQRPLMKLAK